MEVSRMTWWGTRNQKTGLAKPCNMRRLFKRWLQYMTIYNKTETFSICEPYLNSTDAGYSRFKNTYVIASCQGLDGWISTFWELTCCIPTNKIQEQLHLGRKPYHNNHTHNKNVPMSSAGTSHAVKCCFVAISFPNEQATVAVPYPSHATAFLFEKRPCDNHLQNSSLVFDIHQIRVNFSHHNTVNGGPNARSSIGPPPHHWFHSQCSRSSYS